MPDFSRQQIAVISVVVAIGVGVLVAMMGGLASARTSSDLERLAAVPASGRVVEGRLSGPFPYAPYAPGSVTTSSERLRASVAILRAVERAPDATSLDALGQLLATEGRVNEAIFRFEEASRQAPDDARVLGNLAAAALERGAPRDVLLALDASERAASIEPNLASVQFTHALALERAGLIRAAADAWDRYDAENGGTEWAAEARSHAAALRAKLEAADAAHLASALEEAAGRHDVAAVDGLVAGAPGAARQFAVETLMPRWAAATSAGDQSAAGTALDCARLVGDAVWRLRQDGIARVAVARVDTASEAELAALAIAHANLARGRDLFAKNDLETAEPAFEAASREFTALGESVFAAVADLQLARVMMFGTRYEQALALCEHVRAVATPNACPSLAARSLVTTSVLHVQTGDARLSFVENVEAAGVLAALGDYDAAALAHANCAYAASVSYDTGLIVEHQIVALRLLADAGAPDARRYMILIFGRRFAEAGFPYAGLRLLDEGNAALSRSPNQVDLAIAHDYRGVVLSILGRRAEAAAALGDAERAVASLGDVVAGRRVAVDVKIAQAKLLLNTDPAAALQACDAADAALPRSDDRSFVADLLPLVRAEANIRLGDFDTAERELGVAVADVEYTMSERREPDFYELLQPPHSVFYKLAAFLALQRGDPERAFDVVERARARSLLTATAVRGRAGAVPATAARTIETLPANTTLVEYVELDDQLLAFVVDRGGVHFVHRSVERAGLERLADDWLAALASGASDAETTDRASRLYDTLVRPIEGFLPSGGTLVFVPHAALDGLPFGALYDATRGRYLVEGYSLVTAPSASVFLSCVNDPLPADDGRVLVVGDPLRISGSEPLPGAAREAERIGEIYPSARPLGGRDATKASFLAAAPACEIIHFAGHARSDPYLPASTRLLFASSEDGDDAASTLTGEEILSVRFPRARMVVLSACTTIAVDRREQTGAASLAVPFLASGARAVVASLWDIDDEAGEALMVRFHAHVAAGDDAATALARAARELLHGADERWLSPRHWASFQVVGGSGARPDRRVTALE